MRLRQGKARQKTAPKKTASKTGLKTAAKKVKAASLSPRKLQRKLQKATKKVKLANARRPRRSSRCARSQPRHTDPLPDFAEPCLATLADKAPDSGNWIHEIKFDGYRLQARLDDTVRPSC